MCANGFTCKEISRSLSLAPKTVEHHLENARFKMCAKNTPHLVALCIADGIVAAGEGLAFVSGALPLPVDAEVHHQELID